MKIKYTLFLILVASVTTIFSCKKSTGSSTNNYDYLQGYWAGEISDPSNSSTTYGFGVLIKPGNECRLYVNTNGSTIDTTSGTISFDETWSVANNVLKISGQLAQCTANLTHGQATLSGKITTQGSSQQDNFSLTKQ